MSSDDVVNQRVNKELIPRADMDTEGGEVIGLKRDNRYNVSIDIIQ